MNNQKKELPKQNKDLFNSFESQLINEKNFLKMYSQNIQSFINLNKDHNDLLTKLKEELDKQILVDKNPFHFLKDFQNIFKIQYSFFKNYWEKSEKFLEDIKKSVDSDIITITNFISDISNLEEKLQLKCEFLYEQNNYILKSFQEAEDSIVRDYFNKKYEINIDKDKHNIKNKEKKNKINKGIDKQNLINKDQLIDECHTIENDFLSLEKEIHNFIKKFIQQYNSNIKNVKEKMIKLYKNSKDDIINIIQIIKEENNKPTILEEENIKILQNIDINKKESENNIKNYLNNEITEEEFSEIIKINKYKIQIIDKNEMKLDQIFKFKNIKANSKHLNIKVNSKDIFNIIEQIYNCNFSLIDESVYNLDLERTKIEILEKIGKVLGYDYFTRLVNNKIEILSEEELNNYMNILFSNEEHLIYFLFSFNNFRTIGNFELNEGQYNIFTIIFSKISDYLLEHNEQKIYFPLVILSQTFYKLINEKKIFLQNEIRNKKFFLRDEFWNEFFEIKINEELNTFADNSKIFNFSEELITKKRKEIVFNKILSLIPCFFGFDLEKESINKILIPIMDKYNMAEDKRKYLFSFIDSFKE